MIHNCCMSLICWSLFFMHICKHPIDIVQCNIHEGDSKVKILFKPTQPTWFCFRSDLRHKNYDFTLKSFLCEILTHFDV